MGEPRDGNQAVGGKIALVEVADAWTDLGVCRLRHRYAVQVGRI